MAARNERESVQVALRPKVTWGGSGTAGTVQVQCNDLVSASGDRLVSVLTENFSGGGGCYWPFFKSFSNEEVYANSCFKSQLLTLKPQIRMMYLFLCLGWLLVNL